MQSHYHHAAQGSFGGSSPFHDGSRSSRQEEGSSNRRSKGLLPALGVGGMVYMLTGFIQFGTLAMVGVGAGVGYTVGGWLAERYPKRTDENLPAGPRIVSGQRGGGLPLDVQEALSNWLIFVQAFAGGRQLSTEEMDRAWQEFEQRDPHRAGLVRPVLRGGGNSTAGPGVQGSTVVPVNIPAGQEAV